MRYNAEGCYQILDENTSRYQPKIRSETCPNTPFGDGVAPGVPVAVAAMAKPGVAGPLCGVAVEEAAFSALLKAEDEGASLMGVPTVGLEFSREGVAGSSTDIALLLGSDADSGSWEAPLRVVE